MVPSSVTAFIIFVGIFLKDLSPSCLAVSDIPKPISFYYMPGMTQPTYSQPGDINIGDVVYVYGFSKDRRAETCSSNLRKTSFNLEVTESVAFAVDLVNRSPTILPNVTLGFTIRGSCSSASMMLAASMAFLPRTECHYDNKSQYTTKAMTSSDTYWLNHDVIGLLAPSRSLFSLPISTLFSVANLPIVSHINTLNEFSDKKKHPYFFRIVPPNSALIRGIMMFISQHGWSYISMLYNDDSFGSEAYRKVKENIGGYGICMATHHMLKSSTDYDLIVSNLLQNSRARVVVVLVMANQFKKIMQAVVDINATGHFVWIGTVSISSYSGFDYGHTTTQEPAIGTFTFDPYSKNIPELYKRIESLNVNTSKNPWLKPLWEYLLKCSFVNGTCNFTENVLQSPNYRRYTSTPLKVDAVLAFAHATHNLLAERCPSARGQEARACITGPLLKEYLNKLDFQGFNGRVEFDDNQDIKGKHSIYQFVGECEENPFLSRSPDKGKNQVCRKLVGLYDTVTDTITYFNDTTITWYHLTVLDRIVPWGNQSFTQEIPESVCSRPCVVGEYRIVKDVSCCWECLRCRENERLLDGKNKNRMCEPCPPLKWPDPSTGLMTCTDIPPTDFTLDYRLRIAFISLAVIAIVITVLIFVGYTIYRNERVIKASSRELSMIQLTAISLGFTTVILFQTKPTDPMCCVIFFMFCSSFAFLYCPLLVKTVRIFRIFKGGASVKQPSLVSPRSQIIMTDCLIAVQMTLCTVTYILYVPGAKVTQPIWGQKLVELSCDFTLPGLTSFLGYNIVLVSLCSVFAFKTRKLPDNFNESKFISLCVSTTLLIWLAFVPTYFTAHREFVRVFLLSTALLLNHSVALILLFMPKIYAARFLPPQQASFSRNNSQTQ